MAQYTTLGALAFILASSSAAAYDCNFYGDPSTSDLGRCLEAIERKLGRLPTSSSDCDCNCDTYKLEAKIDQLEYEIGRLRRALD